MSEPAAAWPEFTIVARIPLDPEMTPYREAVYVRTVMPNGRTANVTVSVLLPFKASLRFEPGSDEREMLAASVRQAVGDLMADEA